MSSYSYGPKRIIVKQGHRPEGFYFILYGTGVYCFTRSSSTSEMHIESICRSLCGIFEREEKNKYPAIYSWRVNRIFPVSFIYCCLFILFPICEYF